MDITSVFKECLSHNQKSLGEIDSMLPLPSDNKKGTKPVAHSKSTLFPGKKSEHFKLAKDISGNITKLRDFLKENRTAYVNVGASKHVTSNSSVFHSASFGKLSPFDVPIMTDKERDQIDNDVQIIIQNCQKSLHAFQIQIETSEKIQTQPQLHTHLENVVNSLANYLKCVTQIYSEMRAIRVKRTVDYQAMSKLASSKTPRNNPFASSRKSSRDGPIPGPSGVNKPFKDSGKRERGRGPLSHQTSVSSGVSETDGLSLMSGSNLSEAETPVPTYFQDDDDVMSPEELQMLEQENAALLNELNTLSQEVEQIESNVVEIAQLQEIFTEKVLQQERDVDRIGSMIVNATENIRGGNEQVRQAIQKSADFRAYVLFFIMVMSFSLLFLDWYND